jgi:hypothetical protein
MLIFIMLLSLTTPFAWSENPPCEGQLISAADRFKRDRLTAPASSEPSSAAEDSSGKLHTLVKPRDAELTDVLQPIELTLSQLQSRPDLLRRVPDLAHYLRRRRDLVGEYFSVSVSIKEFRSFLARGILPAPLRTARRKRLYLDHNAPVTATGSDVVLVFDKRAEKLPSEAFPIWDLQAVVATHSYNEAQIEVQNALGKNDLVVKLWKRTHARPLNLGRSLAVPYSLNPLALFSLAEPFTVAEVHQINWKELSEEEFNPIDSEKYERLAFWLPLIKSEFVFKTTQGNSHEGRIEEVTFRGPYDEPQFLLIDKHNFSYHIDYTDIVGVRLKNYVPNGPASGRIDLPRFNLDRVDLVARRLRQNRNLEGLLIIHP